MIIEGIDRRLNEAATARPDGPAPIMIGPATMDGIVGVLGVVVVVVMVGFSLVIAMHNKLGVDCICVRIYIYIYRYDVLKRK